MKILFLAANPVDVISQLRIDKEFREISRKIRIGTQRDSLELVSELAVRAGDLQDVLLRHQPDIVHFSGHCNPSGGIILEDENGNRKPVSREAISELFRILKGNIRVVILNACYAKEQAEALSETIDFTIGMNNKLDDKAAIIFSSQFYLSLAFGRSVEEAFELAVNQLCLEGFDAAPVPILLAREGINASHARIIKPSRRIARIGNQVELNIVPAERFDTAVGEHLIPWIAEEERSGKSRPVVFLPWLFACIGLGLMTDILRLFLTEESSWWDTAAFVAQFVLITAAILTVALIVASLMRPANLLVERAASLGLFNKPNKTRMASFSTLIILVVVFGLWLALPVFARYYNERGIEYQYREPPDLSRAREYYQLAVRLKPSYAQAHYNLAIVNEGFQPEKAMEEYLLAIRHDSRIYPAYNNLARLYLLRGKENDYESALNILSQASDLAPQDENVQYSLNKNLGWAHYALKRYPMAEMYLRRAISLGNKQGGAAAHCLLAYVLKEQGKADVADECFDCVSLAPGEKDLEAKWLSDAQDCLMKGNGK